MHGLYLEHYGVKGMKWGVRKARPSRGTKRKKNRAPSEDYTRAKALRKKKPSQLSNQEMRQLNERMQLEENYNRLKSNRSVIQKGLKAAGQIVAAAGTLTALYKLGGKAAKSSAGKTVINAGKDFVKNNLNKNAVSRSYHTVKKMKALT